MISLEMRKDRWLLEAAFFFFKCLVQFSLLISRSLLLRTQFLHYHLKELQYFNGVLVFHVRRKCKCSGSDLYASICTPTSWIIWVKCHPFNIYHEGDIDLQQLCDIMFCGFSMFYIVTPIQHSCQHSPQQPEELKTVVHDSK